MTLSVLKLLVHNALLLGTVGSLSLIEPPSDS
nr:MAG TPA: hypothetical protein [Caudoviricetes sp.]